MFPFDWQLLDWHTQAIHGLLNQPTASLAEWWTGREPLLGLASDSQQSWALLVLLIPVAIMAYWLKSRCVRCERPLRSLREKLGVASLSQLIFCYYLALIFLRYGLDKISGSQFAQPDMYVLFSEFGQLDRDLLYWSVIGSSRSYQWWLGLAEIIPAVLLLWPRWRRLGLWLLLPVSVNVVAVNWSFDISVKLFSGLLLALNIVALGADFRRFFRWVDNRPAAAISQQSRHQLVKKSKGLRLTKILVLIVLILEMSWPYLRRGFFWEQDRPIATLHGAYSYTGPADWHRLYILRDDYWILEDRERKRYRWQRTELPFSYQTTADGLIISVEEQQYLFEKMEADELPALQHRLHWSVD